VGFDRTLSKVRGGELPWPPHTEVDTTLRLYRVGPSRGPKISCATYEAALDAAREYEEKKEKKEKDAGSSHRVPTGT
jgi:hypothetical protein